MFFTKLFALAVALSVVPLSVVSAQGTDDCPEIPETGITIGDPVPIRPGDIPAGCSDFEILVARGTSEPNFASGGGKFGIIVGDPVVSNVTVALSGARGYPVQYPASSQIISGVRQGSNDVVNRLKSQAAACPNQTFSLIGYSQGAAVMHAAAADIPAELYGRIKSLVMFGDGYLKLAASLSKFPAGLDDKVNQVCAAGDPVCDPDGTCTFFHLTYIRPEFIDPAVDFIVQKFTQ
ncbi:hypothetical protein CORC01_00304 [Colletotrichum orchidophilum]|uniref:Cutinase n=1 Tax=Colletotrichum orchidophilum TaxID=1209926 RepID=A0A1G4BSM9_9PEZI|nr:uncharacterized protein CORC01_00304 [Colletotrichum orchidophilum]OHF04452.1 hypothetical protein CORC01_00304 [Colletotrichum orchidophilum]